MTAVFSNEHCGDCDALRGFTGESACTPSLPAPRTRRNGRAGTVPSNRED